MKISQSISIETSEASLAKFDRKTISFELKSIFQVTGFKFLLRFEKHLCSHMNVLRRHLIWSDLLAPLQGTVQRVI